MVGAGVARGWVDSGSVCGGLSTVNMGVFKRIILSWIITIPCSTALSALLYTVLRIIFINADFTT